LLTIKLTNLKKKSKLNKSLWLKNILNIKRKTKLYYNTADNYKKERNKWMKEEKK